MIIQPTRRGLLTGLAAIIAAPAIVRAESLMPLRGVPLTPRVFRFYVDPEAFAAFTQMSPLYPDFTFPTVREAVEAARSVPFNKGVAEIVLAEGVHDVGDVHLPSNASLVAERPVAIYNGVISWQREDSRPAIIAWGTDVYVDKTTFILR